MRTRHQIQTKVFEGYKNQTQLETWADVDQGSQCSLHEVCLSWKESQCTELYCGRSGLVRLSDDFVEKPREMMRRGKRGRGLVMSFM